MPEVNLNDYWDDIPVGKENAINYDELCELWAVNKRHARNILHRLSVIDNGDNYILIRSSRGKGFYKTDDTEEIATFRRECLNRGRNVFTALKKCDRVLSEADMQVNMYNNLRAARIAANLTQHDVCKAVESLDEPLLSKMENGACYPTAYQLRKLSTLYEVSPSELINFYEV